MASAGPAERLKDDTFQKYDPTSATAYAKHRPGYPAKVIDLVIEQHTSTGGKLDLLVDVGCGPGTATRSLSPHFQRAIGADPGESMIAAARGIPSTTKSGEPVVYEVCGAESLSQLAALKELGLPVDLITAATAAHWFDYPQVYREAAKILRPGGSVIFWTSKGWYVDERTTPNAAKVQALFQDFENVVLRPYEREGNALSRDLYGGLPLPWDSFDGVDEATRDLLKTFDKESFVRLEFNKEGQVPEGGDFLLGRRTTFEQGARGLATSSPVARWREVNGDKVARGEMEDCVERLMRQTRELLDEVPEGQGRDWIDAGSALVVMVMKKKA